jgi:hypothetical protein
MAIKIYQSQIRPTEQISEVASTPGMKIDQETAQSIGKSVSKFGDTAFTTYVDIETRKSENEALQEREKYLIGDKEKNIKGLTEIREEASLYAEPSEAKKFYNEQFELLKSSVGGEYKYSFTKNKLNSYLEKQKIEDLNHVGILSTRNFIANTQETEKKYLENLNKKVVYGETQEEVDMATSTFEARVNSDEFKKIFGKNTQKTVDGYYTDRDFYTAKRMEDKEFGTGLEFAKNSKYLGVDKYEQINAYNKTQMAIVKAQNEQTVSSLNKETEDYIIPNADALKKSEETAIKTKDATLLTKINEIKEKAAFLTEFKNKPREELNKFLDEGQKILQKQQAVTKDDKGNIITEAQGADPALYKKVKYAQDYLNKLNTDLEKDPITTANKIGIHNIPSLGTQTFLANPGDTENQAIFAAQVRNRTAQAQSVAQWYGIKPQYFTTQEKSALTDYINNTTNPILIKSVTAALVAGFGNKADDAFKEISKDNKILGHLGGLLLVSNNEKAADDLLKGNKLIKDKSVEIFKDTDDAFQSWKRNNNKLFYTNPDTYNSSIEAAKAIYVSRKYDKRKDTSVFSSSDFKEAFEDAVGKNGKNGGIDTSLGNNPQVIPAWMKNGDFSKVVDRLKSDPALLSKATGGDLPITSDFKPAKIFSNGTPTFVNVGYGKYIVAKNGHPSETSTPGYLLSNRFDSAKVGSQQYLIIDLNKIQSEIRGGK